MLFTPLALPNGAVLPNRLGKAAMEENLARAGVGWQGGGRAGSGIACHGVIRDGWNVRRVTSPEQKGPVAQAASLGSSEAGEALIFEDWRRLYELCDPTHRLHTTELELFVERPDSVQPPFFGLVLPPPPLLGAAQAPGSP